MDTSDQRGPPNEAPVQDPQDTPAPVSSPAEVHLSAIGGPEPIPEKTPQPVRRRSRSWLAGTGLKFLAVLRRAVITALATALITLPIWFLGGTPSFRDIVRKIYAIRLEPASDTLFNVVVADLAGDDKDRTETRRLARALEAKGGGLEAILLGRTLRPTTVGSMREADRGIEIEGQKWLKEVNGDVLVWGEVRGRSLLLAFVPREGRMSRPTGYGKVGERLELPRDLSEEFNDQVQAVALSLVTPVAEERGTFLVARLTPVAHKLRNVVCDSGERSNGNNVVCDPGEHFDGNRANIAFALGLAALTLGEQTGDPEWLEVAVISYRAALNGYNPDLAPLRWAAAQNGLGNALRIVGELRGDTAILKEAVSAYRSALLKRTQDSVPLSWAATQSNMAIILAELGRMKGDSLLLQEAVNAYRSALKVQGREYALFELGTTQSNLGTALSVLGEMKRDSLLLQEAISVYNSSLEVHTQERAPFMWAGTQTNLGNALSLLGVMKSDTLLLKEAVEAHQSAGREYTLKRSPVNWAIIQINLASTLEGLAEVQQNTAYLTAAVRAYERAIDGFSQAGDSVGAQKTKEDLENVRKRMQAPSPAS